MTWSDVENGLAVTLTQLRSGSYVVVRASTGGYVQFAQTDSELVAEATGTQLLPEAMRYSPTAQARLRELGYREEDNWVQCLRWPMTAAQVESLAAASVVVLRDLLQVPDPSRLSYRAWREPSGDDPGQDPLPLPALDTASATV